VTPGSSQHSGKWKAFPRPQKCPTRVPARVPASQSRSKTSTETSRQPKKYAAGKVENDGMHGQSIEGALKTP
jgi:hypothetical protein